MIESSTSKDRRAQLAALFGAILQTLFFIVLLVVGQAYESSVTLMIARWMLGGVVIWPILSIVYSQRRRTEEERREAEQLKHARSADGVSAIFDTEDEAYLIERRRLSWILRWIVPTGAVVLAAYHLFITLLITKTGADGGLSWWSWNFRGAFLESDAFRVTGERGIVMTFVGGVGFLAFLYSRYTAGMARMPGWRMLRSGASYMAGNALACLIALIAIGVQSEEFHYAAPLAGYIIRLAVFVLGIEFLANYALDFYRPRTPGLESRPAFDSRALALITEPGGIARSIAEAINYQFGFEVSSTWFYQLLKRALLPMIAFGLLALFALSSVLIVDADERAVVERFGRRLQGPGEALTPGLYFKAPWPIDKAYSARVSQVRTLTVGTPTDEEEQYEEVGGNRRLKPILWGEKHDFNAEMMLVLASPQLTNFELSAGAQTQPASTTGKAVAVGLLMVSVDIQYSIDDIHGYIYEYINPDEVVENIAYQVLTNYAASVDVDRFLGPGRSIVNAQLHAKLQQRLDEADLGIRILYVALQEAHPTDDVAKSFQDVVKAEIEKETHIQNAHGEAEKTLTAVAGSRSRAKLLDAAILERDRLAQMANPDPDAVAEANERVHDLLTGAPEKSIPPAGGEAAEKIARVTARVQKKLTQAKRDLALFNAEVTAYEAAPELYKQRKYLGMLQEATAMIRKYVVVVDPSKRVLIIYDKESKGTIDLEQPGQ